MKTVRLHMARPARTHSRHWLACLAAFLLLMLAGQILARSDQVVGTRLRRSAATAPDYCLAVHDVGRIGLSVSNHAVIGTGLGLTGPFDCFTGAPAPSCEYPLGSQKRYLWAATLWVGAVVDGDTLVSTGAYSRQLGGTEFHPAAAPDGSMIHRSIISPIHPAYDSLAVSEQDFIAVFSDTCTTCAGVLNDPVDDRPHRPLHVEVTQKSYAWSYLETEDIVLFDYAVENIGDHHLESLYFGVFADADVWALNIAPADGWEDDHSGFMAAAPNPMVSESCRPMMDINAAWTTDNDGDFEGPELRARLPGVFAICAIDGGDASSIVSFDWWHYDPLRLEDFGPQARSSFRLSDAGGLGRPIGDRDMYHLLSNHEVDYDQITLKTIGGADPVWLPPPVEVHPLAAGSDTRFLISVGPYDLEPGETQSVTFAIMVADNLHTVPLNSVNLPDNPEQYVENLDFSNLITNVITANYIYDNPGIDTDLDGYRGEFAACDADTVWYKGDGIPDWQAALPPPPPRLWVEAVAGGLLLKWNGADSETARHLLTGEPIFEGYSAYLGLDSSAASFSKVASYDLEDFRQFAWIAADSDWRLLVPRITLAEAICRYAPSGCNDPTWHPADYERHAPYVMPDTPDSVFYFEPIGINAAKLGLETPFVKTYANAPRPTYATPDQVPPDSIAVYLTDEGYFKYYEYEYRMENLLPGERYWVSVTAGDYGSRLAHAIPRESSIGANVIAAVPTYSDPHCCVGKVGNADCGSNDIASITDVFVLIHYLFIDGPAPCCLAEADLDQSGGADPMPAHITLSDVAALIDHLFIGFQPLPDCIDQVN